MSQFSEMPVHDAVVIGGGVAGLYSAWRLQQAGSAEGRRVILFEGSNRIGGRLLSVTPPGMPQVRAELGGMRFPVSHRIVQALVTHQGLATQPFETDQSGNIAFLRGRNLRTSDLSDPDKLPYSLSPREQAGVRSCMTALVARDCLAEVLSEPDVGLDLATWQSHARSGRYADQMLRDLTMRDVFSRTVGNDAFQFAQDASGYDSIYSTWNAADGFPWKLSGYGKSVDYRCLVQGYEALPLAIAERFKAAGGDIRMAHQLDSFDRVVLDDGTEAIELQLTANGCPVTVLARKLVLALPRRSLELLAPTGAMLGPEQPEVRRLIESVQPVPLSKLVLCYRQRWWEALGIKQGRSVTDLPIRQCYYWGGGDGSDAGFILIYNDGLDASALADLRSDPQHYPSTGAHDQEWNDYPAPAALVEEAHRQLLAMHGLDEHPDLLPYAAAYRDWQADPYGGGANFWPRNVNSDEVAKRILQPVSGLAAYICGEAYSHAQGWVEGALATAEKVLQQHLGLRAPDYLASAVE